MGFGDGISTCIMVFDCRYLLLTRKIRYGY